MRWRSIQTNLPIILLVGVLVGVTGLATFAFHMLSHDFVSPRGQPIENLYWQLAQVKEEHERTLRLAAEARADPSPARQRRALQRYEVFAGRLPIVLQGDGMARIRLYPEVVELIRRIEAYIGETDAALKGAGGDAERVRVIAARLDAAEPLIRAYSAASKNAVNSEEDVHDEKHRVLQLRLMLLFYVIVAVVGTFATIAWWQVRRLDRSRLRLVRLAEELAEKNAHAEAASRAKSDFLANMSHELRTPLNAIIGFSEMIGSGAFGPLPAKYGAYAHDIHRSGQHMLGLVNDLLDIGKIESGRLRLEPKWLDLHGECVNVLRDHEDVAREKAVTLDAAGVPQRLYLHADRHAFRRMMSCLISNAIRFSRDAGRCSVHVRDFADGLHIGVTDTGEGMSPKLIERLMEPFTQDAKKTVQGLHVSRFDFSLTRRYMDMHGGRVEIASAVGKGTTVTLVFPPAAAGGILPNETVG